MVITDPNDVFDLLLKEGFSEEEVTQELKNKIQQFHGFISKQGALFLVAKDLGIKLKSPNVNGYVYEDIEQEIDYDEFTIPIADLQQGMTNIVLLGKVTRVFKIHEFSRKDGTPGQVGTFLLADTTGQAKIVLWDKDIKIMNSALFGIDLPIRIIGGYCKKNQKRNLEVHLGKKGKIILSPEEISESKRKELESIQVKESS
ncbi:MAG: hypothetical protein EU548_10255, partial [Promethearchaeota archaeon]